MIPLAEKIRPNTLKDFIGQEHLLDKGKSINKMIEQGKVLSMILWGPPGSGKTTLARLIAKSIDADFIQLSAVDSGKKDVQRVCKNARELKKLYGKDTILFLDEIHRFNKAQQDALLPFVEDGTIVLIGATTENPGFEVNAPLISRTQLFILRKLRDENIKEILQSASKEAKIKLKDEGLKYLIDYSNGDARTAINALELASTISEELDIETAKKAILRKSINYDKAADSHYDTISAFIKSMRGNEPDAALHYLARMIKGGEDPVFIARRMVIFASEDIGNANPQALILATTCMQAIHMIGMPEAQLIMAQTATYLATSKKSIASTVGISEAMIDVEEFNTEPIPLHLRNPKNKLVKQLGYGKGHVRYPWLEEQQTGNKIKQDYLPKKLIGKKYYRKDWEEDIS